MTEKKTICPCGGDCKCDPCECPKNSCSSDMKSCSSSWCGWGSFFRIAIVVLLITWAYACGVWNGAGHRGWYDRDGYGYKNIEWGMMRHGGMMGQDDDRDDERRVWTVPVKMMEMNSGMILWGSWTGMNDMMQMSMANMSRMLEGKTGDELNKAFLEGMIPHHQAAVDMAKYLAGSNKPELVKLGSDIIAAQTKEIGQMQQWMKDWGYTSSGSTNTGMMMSPSMMR